MDLLADFRCSRHIPNSSASACYSLASIFLRRSARGTPSWGGLDPLARAAAVSCAAVTAGGARRKGVAPRTIEQGRSVFKTLSQLEQDTGTRQRAFPSAYARAMERPRYPWFICCRGGRMCKLFSDVAGRAGAGAAVSKDTFVRVDASLALY